MMSSRVLIVSNRLPVAADVAEDGVRLAPAGGGLATGLRPWHERSAGLWLGWPGDVSAVTPERRADLEGLLDERGFVPVALTEDQIDRYYHGFCNRVLWPLFHYLVDRVPVDATGWDRYRDVNETFADAVVREHRLGDTIWVHDYHLMLLPALLRERLPEARVGFFLHAPFPSSEVFRVLPWRHEILKGVLGADLVGFHTFAYMRHFVASLLHVDGVEADIDRVRLADREVRLGVFPMGVDAAGFAALAGDPEVRTKADEIRRDAGGRRIVLGVDRLDYTKGIPRRLEAVERLFTRDSALRDRIRYIQVAMPSRENMRYTRQVEERVGHINGACGTLHSTPVHYLHRSVSPAELVALYRAADVMLVTPLRDGMNLVAKEFVASRVDENGVLVLSEFAGAAAELGEALIVNPYDVDAVAKGIERALSMSVEERRARMKTLRRGITERDVNAWARDFLAQLEAAHPLPSIPAVVQPEPCLLTALSDARGRRNVRLLLDYDGTLVPFARSPELAAPDEEILSLLEGLAMSPCVKVDIVSGRARETLHEWFRDQPLSLWAEHGFWHRPHPGAEWQTASAINPESLGRIQRMLERFVASTPGSHLEVKSASIAWHYRGAQREFGARQAHELRMLLGDALSNQPFEVLEGEKVIEVRLRGVSKAVVAQHLRADASSDTLVVAIGDDRTDEELFRALPVSALTVAVGRRPTCARFRVDDYRAVRQTLRLLLTDGPSTHTPAGPADRASRQLRRPALVSALLRAGRRMALAACSMTPFRSAPNRIANPDA